MPFAMTHMIIAINISEIYHDSIKDMPQFLLGSIAPDAVHNRANYISDFKKITHLCVSGEPWGMITNDDEWADNVLHILSNNIKSENSDFVLGYCTHVLADIYNNSTLWTPYRLAYPEEVKKGYGGLYYQDLSKIDVELALTYDKREYLWQSLLISHGVDIAGIIFASEIDKQKAYILNDWYMGKSRQDLSENTFVTYESTMNFINDASDYIAKHYKKVL